MPYQPTFLTLSNPTWSTTTTNRQILTNQLPPDDPIRQVLTKRSATPVYPFPFPRSSTTCLSNQLLRHNHVTEEPPQLKYNRIPTKVSRALEATE